MKQCNGSSPYNRGAALANAMEMLAREVMEHAGSFAMEKKISDICATMACHSVVRKGQAFK